MLMFLLVALALLFVVPAAIGLFSVALELANKMRRRSELAKFNRDWARSVAAEKAGRD